MSSGEETARNGDEGGSQELPATGEAVWLECREHWHLAYRDQNNVWRAADNDEPVNTVKRVPKWVRRQKWLK